MRFDPDSKRPIPCEKIPGVLEAGWKPDETIPPKMRMIGVPGAPSEEELNGIMSGILAKLKADKDCWPFIEPVDPMEVCRNQFFVSPPSV